MGISFSSSLFGLAGSLVLGFLDLQMSQAQNRFHTDLEDWLATTVRDLGGGEISVDGTAPVNVIGEIKVAVERLKESMADGGRTGRRQPRWPIWPRQSRGWSTTCARSRR
jgi:hypothetical protein